MREFSFPVYHTMIVTTRPNNPQTETKIPIKRRRPIRTLASFADEIR